MPSAMHTLPLHPRRTLPVRFAAAVCLAAWLAAAPALLPAAFAMLGALDRQHRVGLESRGPQTLLVLRHVAPASEDGHRHAVLARVLTMFAQPTRATPDHIIAFWRADEARLDPARTLPEAPATDAPPPRQTPLWCAPPIRVDASTRPPRSPAISPFALLCLRSTTLLV